jgi:hypothetical protein
MPKSSVKRRTQVIGLFRPFHCPRFTWCCEGRRFCRWASGYSLWGLGSLAKVVLVWLLTDANLALAPRSDYPRDSLCAFQSTLQCGGLGGGGGSCRVEDFNKLVSL